ncbi:FAD-dependent oxidoreductase (plasmid) [Phyllobacterium zundukense]|uniref:NAD(P)/FAD-dependent oxidoreductase n=1 Tax=Phyllobacterium zundukense TaxID=1867719 RepID=UPI000C1B7E16|nr:FAD-binding oxidoreductase [Phyllobacterium zundukense]ATU95856.1 FAD-dependent oxidoreductase [Phyllobacterium zundukense]
MKLQSYWLDTVPPFLDAASGSLSGRADVAVIGGGFTGLAAAVSLAKKGADVVLIEAGQIGSGASGRNGGQCNNGVAIDYSGAVARFGRDTARSFYRAYDAAVDTVERFVMEEAIDCDFRRTGKIKLAAKPEHYEKLARTHEILARDVDQDTTLVSRDRLRTEVGTDRYFGGLAFTKSAGMHMGKFAQGLASAAVRHGARIYERAPVTKLKRISGYQHEVITTSGSICASQVLLATGTSVAGPFARFRRRIVPIGSFIIVTEPLPLSLIDEIMPTRRMATDSKNVGSYFRITPDNRLLFGGRARFAMSSPASDAKSGKILEKAMISVFPQLSGVRIDYCWGGLVDMTADRLPRAGEHEGLFYSMGYSGHGTQMSTHMGSVMADVMSGQHEANVWRKLDWPAIPGHFGKPWFLPFVGAYYRLQDLLH